MRPETSATGIPRRSAAASQLGHSSVSISTSAAGRTRESAASTHHGWSSGARWQGTSGRARRITSRPASVTVEVKTAWPPFCRRSTSFEAARISPTLAPWTQIAPGGRPGSAPSRSRRPTRQAGRSASAPAASGASASAASAARPWSSARRFRSSAAARTPARGAVSQDRRSGAWLPARAARCAARAAPRGPRPPAPCGCARPTRSPRAARAAHRPGSKTSCSLARCGGLPGSVGESWRIAAARARKSIETQPSRGKKRIRRTADRETRLAVRFAMQPEGNSSRAFATSTWSRHHRDADRFDPVRLFSQDLLEDVEVVDHQIAHHVHVGPALGKGPDPMRLDVARLRDLSAHLAQRRVEPLEVSDLEDAPAPARQLEDRLGLGERRGHRLLDQHVEPQLERRSHQRRGARGSAPPRSRRRRRATPPGRRPSPPRRAPRRAGAPWPGRGPRRSASTSRGSRSGERRDLLGVAAPHVSGADDGDAQWLHGVSHGGGSPTPSSAIPCASAAATSASRWSTSVAPAWKASTAAFASISAERVVSPIAGRSKRGSWVGFASLTTQAPGAIRPARRMAASVPSIASTASTARPRTTRVCPIPRAATAFASGQPKATSASCSRLARHAPVGAGRRHQLRHQQGLRQQPDAVLRQVIGDTGEDRGVVPVGQAAQQRQRRGVGTQRRRIVERELRQLAGEHRLGDAGRAQHPGDPRHLARVQPVELRDLGFQRGVGLPVQRHGHHRARAPARRARDLERQRAAPRDQAQRRRVRRGHG